MKSTQLLLLAAILAGHPSLIQRQGSSNAEILITVRLPDGTPAKGIPVQQIQLERTTPRPRNYRCGATDEDGRLAIRFSPLRSEDDERNGYGVYRFVLMPEDYRWELSDLYYWNLRPWDDGVFMATTIWNQEAYLERMRSAEVSDTNWSLGNLVSIEPGQPARWDLVLHKGVDVQVTVTDQDSRLPVGGEKFAVFLDAGVLSHTGTGGEVPIAKVQADANGRFRLNHAGDFWYSFEHLREATASASEFCAPGKPFFTEIVTGRFVQPEGTIRYWRRVPRPLVVEVRDKETQAAIPEAEVGLMINFSSASQGGPIGKTGADGRFATDRLFTEHVSELWVRKPGYEDRRLDIEKFASGGTFVLEMAPKKDH